MSTDSSSEDDTNDDQPPQPQHADDTMCDANGDINDSQPQPENARFCQLNLEPWSPLHHLIHPLDGWEPDVAATSSTVHDLLVAKLPASQ